jgi:hypothetical protein
MSLLKTFMNEMAAAGATGAGGISTGGGHETVADYKRNKKKKKMKEGTLFSGGIVNGEKRNVLKRVMNMETVKAKQGFLESLGVDHGKNDFDASDVLSKIDSAQKQERLNDDTTAFGLEDDEGNLVKVYVKSDQAEEFENTLAAMLAGQTDGEEDENANAKEIAEVMFELKDKFDIVDVEWPGIETDEEEEQEVADPAAGGMPAAGGAGAEGGAEGDMAAVDGGDLEGLEGAEGEDLEGLGDEEDMAADDDAKSALQAVIDVMKADAEAKQAEAEARTAEARAKEAEFAAQGAANKVKREEQVFDMEAAEKEEKERKKEAEQMAKLARFQHSKAQDAEAQLSFESCAEKDEDEDGSEEITLTELTELIFKNLRHQG